MDLERALVTSASDHDSEPFSSDEGYGTQGGDEPPLALNQMINAISVFKILQEAVLKVSVQKIELQTIFPGFLPEDSFESCYFDIYVAEFEFYLLDAVSTRMKTLSRENSHSALLEKLVLEQAICILAGSPSGNDLVPGASIAGSSKDVVSTIRPQRLNHPIVRQTVNNLVAEDRLGPALLLHERYLTTHDLERSLYLQAGYARIVAELPPALTSRLPPTVRRNPVLFDDNSPMLESPEATLHYRDSLGGYPVLKCLGQGRYDSRLPRFSDERRKMIKTMVTKTWYEANNPKDVWGQSAIHHAARYNLPDLVEALLDAGVDPSTRTHLDSTPLHYAAALGHTEICTILISRGAPVVIYDCQGCTPVDYAAKNGHQEIIRLLLDRQPTRVVTPLVNSTPESMGGNTPLMSALASGSSPTCYKELLRFSLRLSLAITYVNKAGQTALHMAAEQGILEAVTAIVSASPATVNHQDRWGRTALCLAAGFFKDPSLSTAMVQELLARTLIIRLDTVDVNGLSALHYAARAGNTDTCGQLLFEFNTNLSKRPVVAQRCKIKGFLPSEYAAQNQHDELATFLRAHEV
ncbi:ankyrin repeat-containing domain protein [Apodospora peruviana]|uniref:Ankyrin repeat-containing domain protein n=1 Tax=Apodospora peruviana TaxID=516989 RepID=A0AAE0IPT9_9PEZI|nr:ankyrin repeat-containing domain protein [Apodospora peruviana]